MKYKINPQKCTECGLCIGKCEKQAISNESSMTIDDSLCNVCGKCVQECPFEAIQMEMVQGLVDFINLPAKDLIELPLYYWSRMSELTADRAGLLACQDLNTAIRAMIKMAGLPQSQYDKINVQAFIDQARDFNEKNTGSLDETFKFIAIANSYHPWQVLRAVELLKWVESGEYDRIINEYRAVECTHCGGDIPAKSKICPICGGKHN